MFKIANLSFGKSSSDCLYQFELSGKSFEVQRFGTNFNIEYMKYLITNLGNSVDAFAISDLPPVFRLAGQSYVHRQTLDIMSSSSSIPLCDGGRIRELGVIQTISQKIENQEIDPTQGIFFPTALLDLDVVYLLSKKYSKFLKCGDLYSLLSLPITVTPGVGSERMAQWLLNMANFRSVKSQTPMAFSSFKRAMRGLISNDASTCQYVFSDPGILLLFGDAASFIKDKDLILTSSHPFVVERLNQFQPRSIQYAIPEQYQISPYINFSVLDAALRLVNGRSAPLSLEEWEALLGSDIDFTLEARRYVKGSRPSPQVTVANLALQAKRKLQKKPAPDFAFVVHPLSMNHLFRVPGINLLKGASLDFKKGIEKFSSKLPGVTYGHVNHIVSKKTGKETNGVLYALLSTPSMLRSEDPEVTYRKIEKICHHAADSGAKIIGLGAYTKIVGDGGATINRLSPIPVTTGNSLSASSTLWAVHEVAKKMGLRARPQTHGLLDATSLVIGATGSIGKVSAHLLSLVSKRLVLVAPRTEKLQQLKNELEVFSPHCEISFSTDANQVAHLADIVITATSAFDQKIVNVENLKPGCIVCDCSRPLDFSKEDALKRPDILIIESGEVVLPGPVEITCDIGLPDNSVYACLGETAVLAMEGLYEPFTLGRDIDWQKVKTIYKLSIEHGVKLAAIRGHVGLITDREIQITKELAIKKGAKF